MTRCACVFLLLVAPVFARAEDCGNSCDDDGDELVDCADPSSASDYRFCGAGASVFLRGDADASGTVDIADAIVTLDYAVLALTYLVQGGVTREPPFPSRGGDYDRESEWQPCRQPHCCP